METETKTIRILIVDDHPIIRHGLSQLINQEEDLLVCGEAENAQQALEAARTLQPDVALVDISLKETSGLDLVTELKRTSAGLPVVMLTMHDEAVYAERSLQVGAQGYVMKQEPPERVIEAVRTVMNGEIYLSGAMTSKMLKKIAESPSNREPTPVDQLSVRELEIFELIGQGNSTRQVAEQLDLSIKTVDAHRANIKKKLELKSGTELVQMAIKWTLSQENT